MKIKTKWGNATETKGYYRITGGKYFGELLHRLIWEECIGLPIPKGYDIHHKDGNSLNNDLKNLQCLPHNIHMSIEMKKKYQNGILKPSTPPKSQVTSEEARIRMKKRWEDPNQRAYLTYCSTGKNNGRYRKDVPNGKELQRLYESGLNYSQLSRMFNLSRGSIKNRIERGI